VLAWMAPIVAGLLLAAHISAFVSSPGPRWIARALETRETIDPPAIVAAVDDHYWEWVTRLDDDRAAQGSI